MIVDERITAYINTLVTDMPETLKSIEKEALADGVPIIRTETGTFLKTILAMHRPKNILEVGAAVGFSAIFMTQYIENTCHITTIERMEERIIKAKENISLAEKQDQITLLEGDALEILQGLSGQAQSYDFIFMDAAKAQYMNYLPEIMKLLPVGGILVTDNVLQDGTVAESRYGVIRRDRTIHQRMREYLYALTHMEELETSVIPVGDGVTLSVRVK